jgi:hypothetical protein
VGAVSVDTPKPGYAGLSPAAQATLDRCRTRLDDATLVARPEGLREYLLGRLTGDAAERSMGAILQATADSNACRCCASPDRTASAARSP